MFPGRPGSALGAQKRLVVTLLLPDKLTRRAMFTELGTFAKDAAEIIQR